MAQIVVKKESLVTLKGALETLKDEFNTSITDIKSNLLNISNNWKGKKADETLSVIETLNKTNSDLLIRINENIEYIQEVITTIDKVESVEVETKPVETPTQNQVVNSSEITSLNAVPTMTTDTSPTIAEKDSNKGSAGGSTIKVTNELLTKLGVKRDSNGKPIKLGNMFVVTKTTNSYKNDYLLFLPTNSNGEIPADLPVFLEFHGNGLSKNHVNLGKTETGFPIERARDEMGLKFTRDNPNFQAIILMPQAENSGNTGNGSKIFNEIYNEVVDTFNTRTDGAIALTFSAGGASYYRYSKDYSKDIKAAYIIDPSTYVNLFQNVPPETPLTFFTSQRTGGDKDYSKLIIGAHKGLNRDLQVYNPILPSQENFQEEIIDILKDSKKPGSRFVNIPTTTHLQANQLVYDDYFYETLLKLWETP